jgi:hypothetical protein
MHYRLNHPDVIQETVDGEAIVIHTPTGVYYSLEGTAEHLWNAFLAGHTPAEIAGSYPDDARLSSAAVIAAIERFAHQLQDEQLLLPRDPPTDPGSVPPASQPFSVPSLQRFTDMQELLLVDPIHEVDPQSGWPARPDKN